MTSTCPGIRNAYRSRHWPKGNGNTRPAIYWEMTKAEICDTLAKSRRVESMVESICHHSLTPDLQDLCQMVYLILLEYDEAKMQDLWEHNEMNFFIARIIINQYRSTRSPFHTLFRKFQERTVSIPVIWDINEYDLSSIDKHFKPRRDK